MKKLFSAVLIGFCAILTAKAEVNFAYEAGAEVVSSYLWRGQYNGGLSFQPYVSVGYEGEKTSFSFGAWGSVGASCEVAYSATKAALIGMTRSLAAELAPSHIRVNCVAPGVIQTDMLDELPPELLPQLAEQTPMGRLGTPADIAAAVAFLASPEADFITGQVLTCDGGFIL